MASMFLPFFKSRPVLTTILAAVMTTGWLHAAPYGPDGMQTEWTQPDGTKLPLRVLGDEFYARTETLDGYTVIFDPIAQAYYYATLSPGGNELTSTGKLAGKADPKALGLAKNIEINSEARAAKARMKYEVHEAAVKQQERWESLKAAKRNYESFKKEVRKQENAGKKGFVIPMGTVFPDSEIPPAPKAASPAGGDGTTPGDSSITPAPPSFTLAGNVVGLTILIDFSDVPGTVVTQTQIDDYCNKPNYTGFSNAGSIYDYFFIQSGGKLRYNNNVTYYVRVPQPKSYYNVTTTDAGLCGRLLLNDALNVLIANGYDFSKLTTKSGGNIRACNVFFAGADSGVWAYGLWPHRWVLSSPKSVGGGKFVYDYQITNIGTSASLRIGTFCHENGHMLLGYPDLYSYGTSAASVGNFSLMDGGNYGGSPAGTHPVHIDSYLKEASGWMDVIDLNSSSNQRCTVQVDGNQTYRYLNPAKATEYFLFELRDNTGYEGPYGGQTGSVNPSSGLVAFQVYETGSNTSSSIVTANNPNCSYTKPFELMVVEANQKTTITPWYDDPTPDTADAFKSSGKNQISDTTTPDLKFWNPLATGGGRLTDSGCNINSISADSNVMTFVAGAGALSGTPGVALSRSTLNGYCDYGTTAASKTFAITNSQDGTLNYTVSDDQAWLSCTPTTGSVTTGSSIITINFATSGLAAGTYTGTITVTDPAASPSVKTITVSLTVTAQPAIDLSTTSIAITGTTGFAGPQTSFGISNSGGGSMNYTVSGTQSWLSLSPASGTVIGETDAIYVNFNATALPAGTYTDTITAISPQANNSPRTIAVTFTVQSADMIVTSPNGGEQWGKGETKTITWISSLGGNVKIELFKGGVLDSTLAVTTANDGSFNWIIPAAQAAASDYTVTITSIENPTKTDTSNASFSIMPTLADALDTTGLTWTTSGNLPWFAQTTTKKDGVDAAQSGAIADSQNSYMETTVTGPGTLTFWWKVSSESGWDYLRFYLDGTEQTGSLAKISGLVDWTQKTVSIPSGNHTVKWGYTKDGSVVADADAAWVDEVVYTPLATPEIAVEEPVGTDLIDGNASIDCGFSNLSSSAAPVTFTVKNTGAADLTGLALSKDGANSADFALGSLGATALAPGASTTFTVTFSASAVGARTAALHIASNDSDESPFDIALTGTGVTVGTLVVSPAANLTSSGSYGGPFFPSSKSYTLSNPGTTTIDWTAAKTAAFVDLSATGGTLGPGDVATFMVSINSSANSFALGSYNDTVTFTNTTNNNGDTTRGVSLTINPIPATVTLGNLSQTYDGSPRVVSVSTNPPGLSYALTYDGSPTAPTDAGSYAVVATITEPNYAGSDSNDLVVTKASQTINFSPLAQAYDNAVPFDLTATASSGLAVAYGSSNIAVANVSGSTVTITGVGTTTITATQTGNNNYSAATPVQQTLTVVRGNPFAVSGGPYTVLIGQSVTLNGGASEPSYNETITAYDWDLNNDNTFGDITGASPLVSYSTFISWGRTPGPNTIQLRVTDSSGKTSTASATVTLVTTITWDANGTGANRTDGAGTWLNPNQWWDGSNNMTWASDNNAIIGIGGAGGAITVGAVSAGTIQLNGFTGTYTLQGTATTLTQSGGITIGATAGNVTFKGTAASPNNFTVGGAGGITMNGPSVLNLRENLVMNYTGATVINNGAVMLGDAANRSAGNFTLNGGILTDYYRVTHAFTSGLGIGTNQIQIHGSSGFGGGNQTSTWRIGATGSTLTWGASGEGTATGFFNPTTLRMRSSQGDNNGGSNIWGWVSLDNRLDLNGATRTIDVYQGGGSIMQSRATIDDGITGSGSSSSLVKNGGGALFIGSSTSNWGGGTTVNGGMLDFGSTNIANIGGGSGRNISVAAGAGVKFNTLSNPILNRIVETTDEIIVMTGTTSNDLDFSSSTGANLPNVWLGNWASNGAKAELSGTITFGGSNYQLGARESSGLLGIVGANKLTGAQGLIVGQTGAASGIRVELASANNFTGETIINTGARLAIGNNLALQNSALNVGSTGGNISFSTGLLSGKVIGSSRADSPAFGGLIGSRNLATVFSNGASNNEQSLQSYQMLGFTLNLNNAPGASHAYSGVIANFARDTFITKNGTGTQELGGVNTYTGVTTINYGILKIGNASALGKGGSAGASAGSTIVNSGGTLDLNGITGILEPIVLNGTGFGGNGALVNNSGTAADISGGLASLRVTAGGVYGGTVPTVTISGGGGTGATATASLGLTNATITSITSGGTSWVVGDQFTVAGGGGSGAVYQVTTVSSGAITGWNIVHAGTGYTSAPTGVTKLTGNSGGTNTFVFNNSNFTVAGLTLTNAGSGYTGTPTISFSTGAATAAAQSSSITLASDSSIGGSGNMTIGAIIFESGGARALTKVGAGTLTLSGDNTYTGPTTVTGGILRITKPYLPNASDVAIGSSGKLDLQFDESGGEVTDTVTTLTIDGVPQPPGIYGATGSGATNINDLRFAGTGTLTVLTGPGGDTTPPALASITDDKGGGLIAANTLVTYTVTFDEDMDASTITADDFGNSGTAAVTIGLVNETTPGVFTVQVTPTSSGTLQLKINQSAVLKDVAGNNLNTTSALPDDTILTVDGTAPTLVSITDDKSGGMIAANTLVTFTLTFSEDMDAATVTAADFANAGSSSVTIGSINETSPGVFTVQATPTNEGTLQLEIIATAVLTDAVGNVLDTVSALLDETIITVDGTAPTLFSITDDKSGGPVALNALVTYTVTFSEDMDASTVSAEDFANAGSSSVTIGSINETSPGVFTVQATPTTAGTLQLEIIAAAELKDVAGNALVTTFALADDTTINVDDTAPTLVSITDDKSGGPVAANTLVTYTVTFSEDMNAATVTAADFGNAGSSAITIDSINETSPGVFTIQATPTTAGTLQLEIIAAAELKDVAGNALVTTSALADDTTINVDDTAPTLVSITDDKSGNPVIENALITYTVTFSEDMDATTVTADDFSNAGSSNITIGSVSEASAGVFIVEVTPATVGTLQLQINASAILKDVAGNNLNTESAIADETVITVNTSDPYAAWAGGAVFDADANGDGVKNGLAWLLGAANPNVNATGLLPVVIHSGGNLTLTFNMLNAASRGSAVLNLQHSSDLGISDAWTTVAVPDTTDGPTNGVSFTVTPSGNLNNVTATISTGEAADGKLYGRLQGQP